MLKNIRHIYFLGIGGIGMSALARYFALQGVRVSGYDKTPSKLTAKLEKEGIDIHFDDWGAKAIDNVDVLVYTPAIPSDFGEFKAFKESGIPMMKRAKVLGEISKDFFTIAIAGTHGKTTITSMVAHFLNETGFDVNAFIGGIASNFNSNLLLNKEAKIMVVEADEFDRSFLHLHPDIAVISSMDADHLDIYGDENELQNTFFKFIENIKSGGTLIIQNDLPLPTNTKVEVLKYGLGDGSDIIAKSLEIKDGKHIFNIKYCNKELGNFALSLPGQHNMLNATVSVAIANKLNASNDALKDAINSYQGVARRFEILLNINYVLIDDYAHHPVEINAAISATRQMFPTKKLMAIFQPHLFTRTRDFADDFARELSKVDSLILLDIYPARELAIEGVNSQMLLDKVNLEDKRILSKEAILEYIKNNKVEITLIMGAGDIDRLVQPIKNILENA